MEGKTGTGVTNENVNVYEPERWGLDKGAINGLGEALYGVWERYRGCFKTKTRDQSEMAYVQMRGQLTMDARRNFAHIEERIGGSDGQALQHFMSNSPWSGRSVFEQLQREISQTPGVEEGSVVILDESADEKAGEQSAGAARQHNGRLGQVGVCQVATCLGYAKERLGLWTLADGELFLPEQWFDEAHEQLRQDLGISSERQFQTKPALGLQMIARLQNAGVPFKRVACDELYGRGNNFRKTLESWHILYAAQVPATTQVYLQAPRIGLPKRRSRGRRQYKRLRKLSAHTPKEVRQLAQLPQTMGMSEILCLRAANP